MLTFTLILEPLWSTRPSCQPGAKTIFSPKRKGVFFLNTLKISLAQSSQEGTFRVMFAGTQHTKEHKELNTSERSGQDTAKITSAPAELSIQSPLCLALMNLLCPSLPVW